LVVCFDVAAEGGGMAEEKVAEERAEEGKVAAVGRVAEGQRFGLSER